MNMKIRILTTTLTCLIFSLSAFVHAENKESEVVTPKSVINLITKEKFDSYPFSLNPKISKTDKKSDVWEITKDGLHVIGNGFGYFRTNTKYGDYHLVMEYKWGEKTWEPRLDRARDCGLLIHGHGPDGSLGGTWMPSIEAQLIEGGSGDVLVLRGKDENGKIIDTFVTAEVGKDRDGESIWKPGGTPTVFPKGTALAGRINWRDRDPDWKDKIDYRGAKDIESAKGWNRMEVICKGDTFEIYLNGEHINGGKDAKPSEGYICIQGEAAECFVRKLELHPLGKYKEKWKTKQ